MASKVVVIVGMHRSGTSLITQWLQRCGLFIGDSLEGPGVGNVQGHFEDIDFLQLHQELLLKKNYPSSGFINEPFPALSGHEQQQLKAMIETKNRQKEEWGWKEPRTCLFLDEYSKLIPSAFYVVVVRDFNSTISSLINREYKVNEKKFTTKKGLSKIKWKLFKRKSLERMYEKMAQGFLKVWIHYYERILLHAGSLPGNRFMFVNYSSLIQNDEAHFLKMKNEWNFSLDYFPFRNVYKEELLSGVRDISRYIKNRKLLEKARAIETYIQYIYLGGAK